MSIHLQKNTTTAFSKESYFSLNDPSVSILLFTAIESLNIKHVAYWLFDLEKDFRKYPKAEHILQFFFKYNYLLLINFCTTYGISNIKIISNEQILSTIYFFFRDKSP